MYFLIAFLLGFLGFVALRFAPLAVKVVISGFVAIGMLVGWLHDEFDGLKTNAPGTEIVSRIDHGPVTAIKLVPPELGFGTYTELEVGEASFVVQTKLEAGLGEMLSIQHRKRGWLDAQFVCVGQRCEVGGAMIRQPPDPG